jgi:5-(carboxyamino)imidazole ribonucleotide synthase
VRLGIIGGGQLARMLALAAHPLGIECLVVEPADDPPAGAVAEVVAAPYDDPRALDALAARCDVVTVELEAVPVDALEALSARVPMYPHPAAVAAAQDRLTEKRLLRSLGIETAPFDDEVHGLPALVKSRRGGFDGRGNRLVRTPEELATARFELPDPIVEGLVAFDREVSIVAARSAAGDVRCWPLTENTHEHGILRTSRASSAEPSALQGEAERLARLVLDATGYVGVLALELFDVGGRLVANEMAPRVHNSGHWTIDGAVTSQFEQHVRAVCGLPLGDSWAVGASVMLNCVGGEPDRAAVLAVPGAHLHLYGKAPRAGRKVGHVTVTAPGPAILGERVAAVAPHVPFVV